MNADQDVRTAGAPSPRMRVFAVNLIWTWLSVIANLTAGIILAPVIIRRLGADGYGIWSLVFSIAGYYTFLEFGLRSAVVNFTAGSAARGDNDRINEVLNTAFAYSLGLTVLTLIATLAAAPFSAGWFRVAPPYETEFPLLFGFVTTGFALSFCFNVASGCLEGLQRFAALNQLRTAVLTVRTASYLIVLWWGGGLIALALCTLAATCVLFAGHAWLLWRAFPALVLDRRFVRRRAFRELLGYGAHTSVGSVSTIFLEQTPLVFIARSLSAAAVGFFSLPQRMLQYPVEIVTRVAQMLSPIAAEMSARRESDSIVRLAVLGNRYSFVLYGPLALLMLTWGTSIVQLWVGEQYARNSGPLLPYFVLGTWLALAGQNASASILFGLRAHQWYTWGMAAEAVIVTAACLTLPRFGLVLIAAVICAAMLASRAVLSPWAVCKQTGFPFLRYQSGIYGRALLIALPVYGMLWWMMRAFPRKTWPLVLLAAAVATIGYLGLAYLFCLEPEHRNLARYWLKRLRTAVA